MNNSPPSQQVTNLKSRYYKYLETLCTSNGIDIGQLKSTGPTVDNLELFFGGLPVLIGLKYFTTLRVLRLFGQDVASLKPLAEVSDTLEELWICEGSLVDITGIEHCRKLRHLYLYGNQIENGMPLCRLVALQSLWLMDNRIKDFAFTTNLQHLMVLKAGGAQFNDSAALSIEQWPLKLHHLDLGGNSMRSLKSLLPLASCQVIRSLNLACAHYVPTQLIDERRQLAWLAFHVPYLERLNNDKISHAMAEKELIDALHNQLRSERQQHSYTAQIKHNSERVEERLRCIVAALGKATQSAAKKEGRKELAIKLHDQLQRSVTQLKRLKRECLHFDDTLHRLQHYYVPSWNLESGANSIRELDHEEMQLIEQFLNAHITPKGTLTIQVRYAIELTTSTAAAVVVVPIREDGMEDHFIIQSSQPSPCWDLRSIITLIDRRDSYLDGYQQQMVEIFKDVSCMGGVGDEWSLIVPIFRVENGYNDVSITTKEQQPMTVPFSSIQLRFVCMVERSRADQLCFDDLRNPSQFQDRMHVQLNKLRELGIDVKVERVTHGGGGNDAVVVVEDTLLGDNLKAIKSKSTDTPIDALVISDQFPKGRWRSQPPFSANRVLSLRSPLELTLAYSRAQLVGSDVLTCLDLSHLKLLKLTSIETLTSLQCLSISHNNIKTLKGLKALTNLRYLDASHNQISHSPALPEGITELNISNNLMTSLNFTHDLPILTRLNVSSNHIKTLKGLADSSCKLLEYLFIADNQLRDRSEIDIINSSSLPKLAMIDVSGNPMSAGPIGDLRKRLLQLCPSLLSINLERIAAEEKTMAQRKTGKVLSLDFLEKNVPHLLTTSNRLTLTDHDFHMVSLDAEGINRLWCLTHLDLSSNELDQLYDLVELPNLTDLNVAKNHITSLSTHAENNQILPKLNLLNLSHNRLTIQTLAKVGLQALAGSLQVLILAGNQLNRMDCALFDLPHLEELDLSANEITTIKKKTLNRLRVLNLADNRLKNLEGLSAPSLRTLILTNNNITACNALNPLGTLQALEKLSCADNPVIERRVYYDFIKGKCPKLLVLDGQPINSGGGGGSSIHRTSSFSNHLVRGINRGVSLFPTEQFLYVNPDEKLFSEGQSPESSFFSITTATTTIVSPPPPPPPQQQKAISASVSPSQSTDHGSNSNRTRRRTDGSLGRSDNRLLKGITGVGIGRRQ